MSVRGRPSSFGRYAFLLGLATLLLYLGFGGLSYLEYQHAREQLRTSEDIAAKEELFNGIRRAMDRLRQQVRRLSDWDEVFQQLNAPAYFAYWYTHRIRGGDRPERHFTDLMIYNKQGDALGHFSSSSLPKHLDPNNLSNRFQVVDGDIRATLFAPLRRSGAIDVQGYLAVQASLGAAIRRVEAFNLIDPASLRFQSDLPVSGLDGVMQAAHYRLRATGSFKLLDDLVRQLIATLGLLVLLPSLLLTVFFIRFLGRSVRRVPAVVGLLRHADGNDPALVRQQVAERIPGNAGIRELATAEYSLIAYHCELSSANRALDQKNQELWSMAHHDALTGAQNRRAFDDYWTTLKQLTERNQQTRRLMLCDINHFKAINDSYGHQTGDAVLSGVADCLSRALRRHEALFRLGGDEFACVLLDCDDAEAIKVARRCENEVRNHAFGNQLRLGEPVRLSIGISLASADSSDQVGELLRQADLAMYAAKRPNHDSVVVYAPGMDSDNGGVFSSGANEAVYHALQQGDGLRMHYQPVVHLQTRRACYHEALLRIEHGGRLITPSEIFPVVESRHLELDLDRVVLQQVLKDMGDGLIPAHTGVSVNLSASSVVNEQVLDWLAPFQAYSKHMRVVVEVTETTLITQMSKASANLSAMREMGLLVALDDFGSGYSSLRYLTSMPVDIVKFDIALVHALGLPAQRRLVQHLVELIAESGQQLVAEGIENESMLEVVREVGFDCVQGWLSGLPQPLRTI